MRIDKWLYTTGLVPSRARAQKACEAGLVEIDGKPAKPSTPVRTGQKVTLKLGMKICIYEVLQLAERPVPRPQREQYRRLLQEERIEWEL